MASFVDASGQGVEDSAEYLRPRPPRPRTGRDSLDLEGAVRLRDLVAAWLVTGLNVAPGDACLVLGLPPLDAEHLRSRLAAHPRDPGQVLNAMRREAFSN